MLRPRCHNLAKRRPSAYLPRRLNPSLPHSLQSSRAVYLRPRALTTLAIETSCDDTAVAILHKDDETKQHTLLFDEKWSSDHRQFKGIEPLVAVQGHTSSLAPLLQRAIGFLPLASPAGQDSGSDANGNGNTTGSGNGGGEGDVIMAKDGSRRRLPDFISVTRGPGIMPNLSVGLNFAKGLAVAWDRPLVGVHHMQAHALTPRLVAALEEGTSASSKAQSSMKYPFLSFLVSGGHTQLVQSTSLTSHRILASTLDVAIGNMLDHAARDILPASILDGAEDVMYARILEKFAFPEGGTPEEYAAAFQPTVKRGLDTRAMDSGFEWEMPLPLAQDRRMAYSFTAIGATAKRIMGQNPGMPIEERRVLAQHTMAAAWRCLMDRLFLALENDPDLRRDIKSLVVAGGVACNKFLMYALKATLEARKMGHLQVVVPPVEYCTDNAAMIAWVGMEMFEEGWTTGLDVLAINKWPLDGEAGPGLMGVPGWENRNSGRIEG